MTLFDPSAHDPLLDATWERAAVEAEIRAIARDADDALRDGAFWPVHPLDHEPGDPEVFHGVYMGAAGMLWALDQLARWGLHEPRHDYARLATEVLAAYLERPEFDGPEPSLWIGEGGITLVAWLLAPTPELADRLEAIVTAEPANETLELMWGSPGLLLIADALLERTGEERWRSAWTVIADRLLASRGAQVPGFWSQDLYGSVAEILGPAHGLTGVIAALARRPELRGVPSATRELAATAVRSGGLANWPPALHDGLVHRRGFIRTQWCHGAPGIVCSMAALPRSDELDALLLAGGELTWTAGPLRKGANLCHGTAGNGFALLKLFARTGDELWLERARRFAMHSAAQVAADRGRYSLWTGDIGTAIYLRQCLAAESGMPNVDGW